MATTTDTACPTSPNIADAADVADVSTVLFIKLADLDELVEHGNQRQALRQARQLLDHTDGDTRAELADLVESLEQQRNADWVPPQPRHLTRWVPPSRVRIHRQAPRTPAQRTSTAQATAEREGDAAAAAYLAERGDVDDDSTDHATHAERPPGYELDYDLAALAPLRGRPCLNLTCRVERTRRPAHARWPVPRLPRRRPHPRVGHRRLVRPHRGHPPRRAGPAATARGLDQGPRRQRLRRPRGHRRVGDRSGMPGIIGNAGWDLAGLDLLGRGRDAVQHSAVGFPVPARRTWRAGYPRTGLSTCPGWVR
jgi:hypothetical protein